MKANPAFDANPGDFALAALISDRGIVLLQAEESLYPRRQKSVRSKQDIQTVAQPAAQAVQCRGGMADEAELARGADRVRGTGVLGAMQNELIEDQRVADVELRCRRRADAADECVVAVLVVAGEHRHGYENAERIHLIHSVLPGMF